MNHKIILFFALIMIPLLGFSQVQDARQDSKLPVPFHIHVKAFEKGELVFELNTKKQKVVFAPEERKDTTYSITWNRNDKVTILKFLKDGNILGELQEDSVSKPVNIDEKKHLFYLNIHKGEKTMEFWSYSANSSASFELMAFVRELMVYYESPYLENRKRRRR
jgi:hypothetical protein